MAVIQPIEARRGIDTGSAPSVRVSDAIGQGLRSVGGAISQAAEVEHSMEMRRERMKMEMQEFRADQAFRRFGDDFSLDFAKTQQEIDPSGEGFAETVGQTFNKKADEFLQTVPDALKPKFAELITTSKEAWLNKAAAAEIDQRNTWYRTGITEAQEKLQTQVFNDPALYEAAKQDGLRAIASSGLPKAEKETLAKAWEETLSLTVGEREIRDAEQNGDAGDAARRLGVSGRATDGIGSVVDRIIGVESGGNARAKNPRSSAEGLGQFIDSTWVAMLRKHRPDIANGRTPAELIALKTDPALSREMTEAYTADNAAYLRNRSIPTTPGNLYLAHFAGPGGAVQVLKADPSASVAAVLGQDKVRANPFLKGMTVSQLAAWADRKMGGGGAVGARNATVEPDPRYAALSLEKRLELYDRMQAAEQAGQTRLRGEATAAYDAHKGSLELGIENGQVASERTILDDPVLKDADKADLLASFRKKNEEAIATQEAVRLFSEGQLRVDPYDTKGRKSVDNAWKAISSAVPQEQLQPTVEDMVRQTGVVPQQVVNLIRQGLTSQSVQDVVQAAQAAQRIAAVDPAALSRRDGGTEAQNAADDFSHYVNRLNLSPEEAAKRMVEANRPENKIARKALEPAAKEFVKELEKEDLASVFNDSWFASGPELGFSPGQALSIQADFIAIAEDQFFAANGDPEIARNRAVEQMKRLYGVTEVTGRRVVTKHPPEFYWPKFRVGVYGETLDYARIQLEQDLKQFAPDIDMGKVQLVTTPETDAMVKRGEMPGYAVMYQDASGVLQTIPGKLWRPDVSDQTRMKMERDAAERAAQEDEARRMQGVHRQEIQRRDILDQKQRQTGQRLRGEEVTPVTPPRIPQTPQGITQQRQQLREDAVDSGLIPPQNLVP